MSKNSQITIENDEDMIKNINMICNKGNNISEIYYNFLTEFINPNNYNNFYKIIPRYLKKIGSNKNKNNAIMIKMIEFLVKNQSNLQSYIDILEKCKSSTNQQNASKEPDQNTSKKQDQDTNEQLNQNESTEIIQENPVSTPDECIINSESKIDDAINCICRKPELKNIYLAYFTDVSNNGSVFNLPVKILKKPEYSKLDGNICNTLCNEAPIKNVERNIHYSNIIKKISECIQSVVPPQKEELQTIEIPSTTISSTIIPSTTISSTIKPSTTIPSITPAIAVAIAASQPPTPPPTPPTPPPPTPPPPTPPPPPPSNEKKSSESESTPELPKPTESTGEVVNKPTGEEPTGEEPTGPTSEPTKVLSNDAVTYITPQGLVYIHDKKTNEITEYEGSFENNKPRKVELKGDSIMVNGTQLTSDTFKDLYPITNELKHKDTFYNNLVASTKRVIEEIQKAK